MSASLRLLVACAGLGLGGCTVSMVPGRLSPPPPLSLEGEAARPLGLRVEPLVATQLELHKGPTTYLLDTTQYAAELRYGLTETLAARGYRFSDDAADRLDVTFLYATLVSGAWRAVCYIDIAAATSAGYVRGFQGQGEDLVPREACDEALAQCVSQLLADPGIYAFLSGAPAD